MKAKDNSPKRTHEELVKKMLSNPKVKAEYDHLEPEFALLEELLSARHAAGLTQAEVAARMGTKAPAVTRLESGLVSGTRYPSLPTLKKYADAVGRKLQIRLI